MKATESSSHVSFHVDLINMKNSKKNKKVVSESSYEETTESDEEQISIIKKRKGKRIDTQSTESSYEETTESDEERISMIKNRKGKKIDSREEKKSQLVFSVKKIRKNDEGSSKPKKLGKMVVVENINNDNENKSLQTRMSAKNLKKIIDNNTNAQMKALDEMGFGNFKTDFKFNSTPTSLGLWILENFDLEKCSLTLSNNRKIKVTRELIHEILGIPMGDKKVVYLKETSTEDATTRKWRASLPLSVYDPNGQSHQKKILIGKLERHLCSLSHGEWDYKVGFLVVFFSIFAHGNKDGTINQRFLPSVENIEEVPNLDWCSISLDLVMM